MLYAQGLVSILTAAGAIVGGANLAPALAASTISGTSASASIASDGSDTILMAGARHLHGWRGSYGSSGVGHERLGFLSGQRGYGSVGSVPSQGGPRGGWYHEGWGGTLGGPGWGYGFGTNLGGSGLGALR